MNLSAETPKSSGRGAFVKKISLGSAFGLLVVASTAWFVPGPIQRDAYMGAQYCGSCHQAEYAQWASSTHAQAFARLPDNKKGDQACLSCHATGVLEPKDKVFAGVQCESCHGPGQYYAALHIKKDAVLSKLLFKQNPSAESCLHCHSRDANLWSPHDAMKKINHWSNSEAARNFHQGTIPQKGAPGVERPMAKDN
jgi:hypothetical protein